MSLATRCPKCQTLFKVTLGQLQVYEGQVRCGQCKLVFSGIDHLTAADTEAWSGVNLSTDNTPATSLQKPEPDFLKPSEQKNKKTRVPSLKAAPKAIKLSLLSALIFTLLHLTWWQRTSLASQIPALASWVSQSGENLQWMFALPADTSLELQGSGMSRLSEDKLQVEATLRNINNLPSRWPHLLIRLRDSQGNELASKLLKPSDYIKRSNKVSENSPPIAPGETVEIIGVLNLSKLTKQLPGASATGFEILLYNQSIDLI